MSLWVRRAPVLVSIPLLVLLWALAADQGWVGKSLLAGPQEVVGVFGRALHPSTNAEAIFEHALHSLGRALVGWSISLAGGGALGLLLGFSPLIYRATEPLFEFARAIPPIMGFPLFLVAFNFGAPAYIWTIAAGCLPIMVLAVARGIHGLDRTRRELLAAHDVSPVIRALASAVEIMPSTFFGARLTFSISLIIGIVTEMVFSPRSGFGLGALAKDSQISFDTPTFFACIVILGAYGYTMNVLMRHVEQRLSGETHTAS
ncbi:MAG: ABC transporter permease subunit [Polyangiaceae bacterium]